MPNVPSGFTRSHDVRNRNWLPMGKRFDLHAAMTDLEEAIPVTVTREIFRSPNTLAVVSVM